MWVCHVSDSLDSHFSSIHCPFFQLARRPDLNHQTRPLWRCNYKEKCMCLTSKRAHLFVWWRPVFSPFRISLSLGSLWWEKNTERETDECVFKTQGKQTNWRGGDKECHSSCVVCGRTFRMSLSGARTVGGPFHRWRPPVGTPIMSLSANGEQYTQSWQKGSVKQGQGFKELPIFKLPSQWVLITAGRDEGCKDRCHF